MVGGTSRRDSWDAIAKTKSLLSYGSLESLANLANSSSPNEHSAVTTSSYTNNNYRSKNYSTTNMSQSQDLSVNHNTLQNVQTNNYEYNAAHRFNENQNESPRTHGILKNKDYNNHRGVDTTDATHPRFIGNSGSAFRPAGKDKLVTGDAQNMLAVHRPTAFTLDSSIDASKATVRVTGKNQLSSAHYLTIESK